MTRSKGCWWNQKRTQSSPSSTKTTVCNAFSSPVFLSLLSPPETEAFLLPFIPFHRWRGKGPDTMEFLNTLHTAQSFCPANCYKEYLSKRPQFKPLNPCLDRLVRHKNDLPNLVCDPNPNSTPCSGTLGCKNKQLLFSLCTYMPLGSGCWGFDRFCIKAESAAYRHYVKLEMSRDTTDSAPALLKRK